MAIQYCIAFLAIFFFQTAPVSRSATAHFSVTFDKDIKEETRKKAESILEEAYAQYTKELNLTTPRKIPVRLVSNRQRYNVETPNALFDNGEFQSDKIILNLSLLEQNEKQFSAVVTYCVVSAITAQNNGIPRWFGTAYALYAGNEIRRFEQYASVQMYAFSDIDEEFDRASSERELKGVYSALGKTIRFLVEKFGERRVKGVLTELKTGKSLEAAFRLSFNEPLDDLQREWQHMLSGKSQ